MRDPGDFVTDYDLSYDAMAALGWHVETVIWDDPAQCWDDFDAVYICTPWDYPEKLQRFLDVLTVIDQSSAVLVNDLLLVHWTLQKTYLQDLQERGGAVVPSLWYEAFDIGQVSGWFEAFGPDMVVVKPQVGANAQDTFVLEQPVAERTAAVLAETFSNKPFFVQPFMHRVQSDGEYSLFFFGGEYSHAIRKVPASGDFRTQEEHGAEILSISATAGMIDAASRILALVHPAPAYVRVDFVADDFDNYLLMELELIEPSLYLRTDDAAAARFAAAFDTFVNRMQP
jgi:glutathione synthase/RimK-type ligase-like ATP-grasp enzyme